MCAPGRARLPSNSPYVDTSVYRTHFWKGVSKFQWHFIIHVIYDSLSLNMCCWNNIHAHAVCNTAFQVQDNSLLISRHPPVPKRPDTGSLSVQLCIVLQRSTSKISAETPPSFTINVGLKSSYKTDAVRHSNIQLCRCEKAFTARETHRSPRLAVLTIHTFF